MEDGKLEAIIECTRGEATAILADLIFNVAKAVGDPLPAVLMDVVRKAYIIANSGAERCVVDLSDIPKPGAEGAP